MQNEQISPSYARLYPVDRFRSVSSRRSRRSRDWEVKDMEGFANLISMLDYVLDTKRKRHITGGILLSAAVLFGGLAITVMSIKDDDTIEMEENRYE